MGCGPAAARLHPRTRCAVRVAGVPFLARCVDVRFAKPLGPLRFRRMTTVVVAIAVMLLSKRAAALRRSREADHVAPAA